MLPSSLDLYSVPGCCRTTTYTRDFESRWYSHSRPPSFPHLLGLDQGTLTSSLWVPRPPGRPAIVPSPSRVDDLSPHELSHPHQYQQILEFQGVLEREPTGTFDV